MIARRILYVDASFNNITEESKISLYDKDIGKLDTLILSKPTNSSEAEKYGIVYACLYSQINDMNGQKVHILNDNSGAVQNNKILDICKNFNLTLSWIPREINEIADKGTKLANNIKEHDIKVLELFYDLMINKCSFNKIPIFIKEDTDEIPEIDKIKNILKNAIRHSKLKDNTLVSIGEVGKYLIKNNPTYTYPSLKKELEKYLNDFQIINNNFVKIV